MSPDGGRAFVERFALAGGLVVLFIVGYFGVGLATDPARARELGTALDRAIPFVPASIWIYLWVFPADLIPVFVVRCPRLYRRTIVAYAIAMVVSYVIFAAFPVTSLGLRADPATLDPSRPSEWAVLLLYSIDPPFNLFPSMHLSIATLAAFSAWTADRRYGAATFFGVALVGISITTVKQHFIVDGIAGFALGALVYALLIRPYRPVPGYRPAFGWRGVALYAVLLVAAYAGMLAWWSWSTSRV